jgi:hypothetical protein
MGEKSSPAERIAKHPAGVVKDDNLKPVQALK